MLLAHGNVVRLVKIQVTRRRDKADGFPFEQSATDLHISQALLSHYEKGIRECGLDFVVAAADYYGVSCDYLLGRTADKAGTIIAVEEIPEQDSAIRDSRMTPAGVLPVLNKKLLVNSLQVIFDLLQKSNNKELTIEVSNALVQMVYVIFRLMYTANGKNPKAMFAVEDYRYHAAAWGSAMASAAQVSELCRRQAEEENLPSMLPDELQAQYPQFASSLLNLLRTAEKTLEE